jgi:hypothetical protein
MRDQTTAMALQLAEKKLVSMGFRFAPSDIGRVAGEIIRTLDLELEKDIKK